MSDNHSENSNSSMESDFNNDENARQGPVEVGRGRENRSASISSSSGCSSIVEETQQTVNCR